ncbi:hypothetical protein DERF_003994 [Dermatophagoides farinae]|uniref:Uncharacterized protein n=1 Tax=Dermatophagoides farinae TaxID=6954 RepID=A0A922LBZ7_DERFA|nr:hypothetical protein DERF_003994 [Dermatophagoides farinae]
MVLKTDDDVDESSQPYCDIIVNYYSGCLWLVSSNSLSADFTCWLTVIKIPVILIYFSNDVFISLVLS